MLLVQLKYAGVSCGNATLRTSPSSGQATIYSQLRHPQLLACHSGAALAGPLMNGTFNESNVKTEVLRIIV